MVNGTLKDRPMLWTLVPAAAVLVLAAWLRGAEYDEQYTLFLTAGLPRPDWPETAFPAGLARSLQSGRGGLAAIGHDLRVTDVHPPLYFWLLSLWRQAFGDTLFAARLFSVACGLGALALTGTIATAARVPAARAMLLTLGCYGFTYTCVIARGFALAQLLLLGGAACLSMGRRTWHFAAAGALFGAAALTNYLSVFVAGACLAAAGAFRVWPFPHRHGPARPHTHQDNAAAGEDFGAWRHPLARFIAATFGFLVFMPAVLWWFLAQKGSRQGQFPPFELLPSLIRLAGRAAGALLGGLPLYVDGVWRTVVSGLLGCLLAALAIAVLRHPARANDAHRLFALATIASPLGLLALGLLFNSTPIELRYLAFSLPFAALLLAGALGPRLFAVLLLVQTAAIAGLIHAPQTMQPGQDAARSAAALAGDGIVLLPKGNDGVGVPGAFAIEAPPSLPILLIRGGETPDQIRARLTPWRRVVLAPLEQDDASQAASRAMRAAIATPEWREVAHRGLVAVYERTGGAAPAGGE